MAIDEIHQHVIIGYRHPAKLEVLESKTGNEISINDMTGDADDLYYDAKTDKIFVSGGSGYVNIFQGEGAGSYKQIANIQTRNGARTSLLVPELHIFLIAARSSSGSNAELEVYKIN